MVCFRITQLLTCLVRNEGRLILNILNQVGRMYPQAVYFPIRTLYLTLKIEQRERYKSGELSASVQQGAGGTGSPAVVSSPATQAAASPDVSGNATPTSTSSGGGSSERK